MPSRCVIAGCNNCTKDGVSVHRFPSDPKYRRVWTAKVNHQSRAHVPVDGQEQQYSNQPMNDKQHTLEPTCFDRGLYSQFGIKNKIKQMLFPDAIPTIFSLSKKAKKLPGKKRGAFTKREQIRV